MWATINLKMSLDLTRSDVQGRKEGRKEGGSVDDDVGRANERSSVDSSTRFLAHGWINIHIHILERKKASAKTSWSVR